MSDYGKVDGYPGGSEGTVEAPDFRGTGHWTFFNGQQERHCKSPLFRVIATEDFESLRYQVRPQLGGKTVGNDGSV